MSNSQSGVRPKRGANAYTVIGGLLVAAGSVGLAVSWIVPGPLANVLEPRAANPIGQSDGTTSVEPPSNTRGNTGGVGLSPQWFGIWTSADGKKRITLSAKKISVIDRSEMKNAGDSPNVYGLEWSEKPDLEEGQFGYSGKSISIAQVATQYAASVAQFKKDPTDFAIGDEASAQQALASISPGNYKIVGGYLGGDCHLWDWILDGDRMLEITQCKYYHGVRLYTRTG